MNNAPSDPGCPPPPRRKTRPDRRAPAGEYFPTIRAFAEFYAKNFTSLASLVKASEMSGLLDDTSWDGTLFAPINEAFQSAQIAEAAPAWLDAVVSVGKLSEKAVADAKDAVMYAQVRPGPGFLGQRPPLRCPLCVKRARVGAGARFATRPVGRFCNAETQGVRFRSIGMTEGGSCLLTRRHLGACTPTFALPAALYALLAAGGPFPLRPTDPRTPPLPAPASCRIWCATPGALTAARPSRRASPATTSRLRTRGGEGLGFGV